MNAVVTGMDVFRMKKMKSWVMLVEVDEGQQNIEECVVDLSVTLPRHAIFW